MTSPKSRVRPDSSSSGPHRIVAPYKPARRAAADNAKATQREPFMPPSPFAPKLAQLLFDDRRARVECRYRQRARRSRWTRVRARLEGLVDRWQSDVNRPAVDGGLSLTPLPAAFRGHTCAACAGSTSAPPPSHAHSIASVTTGDLRDSCCGAWQGADQGERKALAADHRPARHRARATRVASSV
jgi:hypothetical protein